MRRIADATALLIAIHPAEFNIQRLTRNLDTLDQED